MQIKDLFISPTEQRLRTLWRLAVFAFLTLLLAVIVSIPTGIALALLHGGLTDPGTLLPIGTAVSLVAISLSVWICRRWVDRRSFRSLGLDWDRRAVVDLLAGLAIAFLIMGAIFLVQLGAGWLTVERFAWQLPGHPFMLSLSITLAAFLAVGFYEELLARGYLLQNLEDGLGQPWGLALSSLVFALLHWDNPSASLLSTAGIFLAGLFLAYGYTQSGRLWLPIGLHIGWNISEGVIFGFPVSGVTTVRLIQHTVRGPALWTGGDFGPEGGLLLLPGLLLGVVLVWLYTRAGGTGAA